MDSEIFEDDSSEAPRGSSRHASTALFVGVIALVSSLALVGGLIGIGAILLSRKALRRIRASQGGLGGKAMAIAGLILGILAIAAAIMALGVYLVIPAILRARREAAIVGTENHMRLILDACRQYAVDDNDFLPPSLAPVVSLYSLRTTALRDVRNLAAPMTQPATVDPEYGKYEAEVAAHSDFIYTGNGLRLTAKGLDRLMVLFAKARTAGGERLIGFADGHVERVAAGDWPGVIDATNEALAARHRPPLPEKLLEPRPP